ncbi:MAG TPA: VWA domain-containing protein [Saprospiraceae bacterium]|nr:VWA domain-containing protein [Saprospiraceae bacterium]
MEHLSQNESLTRWRMILGSASDQENTVALDASQQGIDQVLEALYESDRKGSLGKSAPNINRWLGDIRRFFPTPLVQLLQKDALDRLGIERMLLEPELLESIEVDASLVATILSLNKVMPERTRESARIVVSRLVKDLENRLSTRLLQAISGSFDRASSKVNNRSGELDWRKTIRANLKHYQPDLQILIPEKFYWYGRKNRSLKKVILLVDQSGSMATSVVYASIMACIMASLKSVKTHLIVFDTAVVDLTPELADPIEVLFGLQLGGGTDIGKAMTYAETLVQHPNDTTLILISDLFEGGQESVFLRKVRDMKAAGVQMIFLLALSDSGAPAFNRSLGDQLAALDLTAFACTPDQFPGLMATALAKGNLQHWMEGENIAPKNN